MQQNRLSVDPSTSRTYLVVLIAIVAAYCGWVMSLPLFPTQDGPMHLYFVHVLHALLRGDGGFYQQFYFVRHILPPYSLYYYTLMLLSSFLPVLTADKVVVCLYFVSFAFGFRYLAKAIGPSGELMALPATIFLLNWPLGMGFVNFCLSTSFAFWALGLWLRALESGDQRRRVGFVLMMYVIMLTHPVPLLAVLGFCFCELAIRLVRHRVNGSRTGAWRLPEGWTRDAVYVLIASGTLVYVKLFTTRNVLKQLHNSPAGYLWTQLGNLHGFVMLHSVTPFSGSGLADAAHRMLLYGLLLFALVASLRQLREAYRSRVWGISQTWAALGIVFLILFPFIPGDLNNSAYFAARLVIYAWLILMMAASGMTIRRPAWRQGIVALTVGSTALSLSMAYQRINPIAKDIARIEQMPVVKANSVGLLLHDPSYTIATTVTYDPYFWSGARMFRRSDSVMYNTPWLDLQIIPLGPRATLPTYRLKSVVLEVPAGMRKELTASSESRSFVFSHVNLAIVSSGRRAAASSPDELLREDPIAGHTWSCGVDANYSICAPHGPPTADVSSLNPLP